LIPTRGFFLKFCQFEDEILKNLQFVDHRGKFVKRKKEKG